MDAKASLSTHNTLGATHERTGKALRAVPRGFLGGAQNCTKTPPIAYRAAYKLIFSVSLAENTHSLNLFRAHLAPRVS